jgi:hypothetical protein
VTDEVRQTTYPDAEPCPTCGGDHSDCNADLLHGMYLMACEEARVRLSEEGVEVFDMLRHAADHIGDGEAYDSATAVEGLSEREITAIEVFLARKTLIEETQKELGLYVAPKGMDED